MNRNKLNEAIDKLTNLISEDKEASNALQLLIADYYITKAQVIDLNNTIDAAQLIAPLSNVLTQTQRKKTEVLNALEDISHNDKQILQNLSEAQSDIAIAQIKIHELVEKYREVSDNADLLIGNVKNVVGGSIKTILGPAAEIGPISDIADQLFA